MPFDHQIHPFEQGQKLSVTQGPFTRPISRITGKLPLLEPLAPDTVAIAFKRQQFHLGTATIDENKPMTAGWIFTKVVSDHRR